MRHYCCVPLCNSTRYPKGHRLYDPDLTFHEFPSREGLRVKWILAIMRKDPDTGGLWSPCETSRICGRHFPPEVFKVFPTCKRLYSDAIPTVFDDYPPYMKNRLLTKRYKRSLYHNMQNSPKNKNFNNINLREETNLEIQDSALHSSNINLTDTDSMNKFSANLKSDVNISYKSVSLNDFRSSIDVNEDSVKKLSSYNVNEEQSVNYTSVNSGDNVSAPLITLKENEPMDISDNAKSNDDILAAVVLPSDQSVKVHKIESNKHYLKEYAGRCSCDSTLKIKLQSSQKDGQRLRRRIEQLKEENINLTNALKRANSLLKTYCIEKLQEGVEDDDSEALLLKNQLIEYSKKKEIGKNCRITENELLT